MAKHDDNGGGLVAAQNSISFRDLRERKITDRAPLRYEDLRYGNL